MQELAGWQQSIHSANAINTYYVHAQSGRYHITVLKPVNEIDFCHPV